MSDTFDAAKPYYIFTCQDGKIVRCEFRDKAGKQSVQHVVKYNDQGAPLLVADYSDGAAFRFKYGEFGNNGRPEHIYTFNASYELTSSTEYLYEGQTTRIKTTDLNSKVLSEMLYADGSLFQINGDQKKKLCAADRDQEVRGLVKLGLKPFYPGY